MKTNSEVRYASHPMDAKHYDTRQLREHYLIEKVFTPDEVNVVYTMHDRLIAGGVMPVSEVVELRLTYSATSISSAEGKWAYSTWVARAL